MQIRRVNNANGNLRRSLGLTEDKKYSEILKKLECLGNPEAVKGMALFGIKSAKVYGVSAPNLRRIAKETGKNHVLAQRLWVSGIYEARIIACMIDDPGKVSEAQLERWVKDLDSWAVCDGCCSSLFDKTEFAYRKAIEWSERQEEYVKRAGFVLMATLAVHDKKAEDEKFLEFFPLIKKEAVDERNFVKKAVNWALRQIGKRNLNLNKAAVETATDIHELDSSVAKWISSDALRELKSAAVQRRLRSRKA
jgi:3-methyladenine DNA glycosylase AlkD